MGNTAVSSTVQKTVTDQMNSVMIQNTNTCTVSSATVQTIDFSDMQFTNCTDVEFSNIKNDANINNQAQCLQSSDNGADIQNQFIAAMDKTLTTNSSGIAGALLNLTKTDTTLDAATNIANTMDIASVAQCVMNATNAQLITFKGLKVLCPDSKQSIVSFKDLTNNMVLQNKQDCIQNQVNKVLGTNAATVKLTEDTTATNKGTDLAALLSAAMIPIIGGVVGAVVLITIIVIIVVVMKQKAKKALIAPFSTLNGNPKTPGVDIVKGEAFGRKRVGTYRR